MAASAVAGERRGRRGAAASLLTTAGLIALAILLGAALPLATSSLSPRVAEVVPFALLALVAVLMLAFGRPRGVLVAGFALLSVVRSDPAPSDLLFVVL